MILDDRQKIISMLTAARIEKGISQQELADRIGTKRSNIGARQSWINTVCGSMTKSF